MKLRTVSHTLIFSVVCLMSACGWFHKSPSGGALIKGQIDPAFTRSQFVYFYQFTDSMGLFFGEKKATDSCQLGSDGSFHFEIKPWQTSGFFDLGTNDIVFARNYFLQPGDQLQLDFTGKEMPLVLKSYEPIGKYNTFLQVFNDTFYRNAAAKRTYFVSSNFLLAPDYSVYINMRKNDQIAFFHHYFGSTQIDSTFNYYFEHETNYNWANDKTYFLWKKRMRQEEVPVDTTYFEFLKIIQTDDPRALICPGYVRFINLYLRELYQEEISRLPLGRNQSLEKCFLTQKYLRGIGQKVAFYTILRDEMTGVNSIAGQANPTQQKFVDSLAQIAFATTNDSSFLHFVHPVN